MSAGHPIPASGGERDVTKFTRRLAVASGVTAVFAALAVADTVGFAGMPAGWWLLPVAIGLAVAAIDELVRLFALQGLALPGRLLRPGVAAVVLVGIVRPPQAATWPAAALALPAIVHVAVVLAIMAVAVVDYRAERRALERLSAAVLTATYVGLLLSFVVALRFVNGPLEGRPSILPLASLVAVVKGSDIAAYAVGVAVGRTKMAPLLSPGKTWEGAVASLVGGLVISWMAIEWIAPITSGQPAGGWLLYGVAVVVAGIIGDLAESLLKRELHAKDSGRVLGGLGGVLDLIDSLLLAAPVAWLLWAFGQPAA